MTLPTLLVVVLDTTKVQIFKQITTQNCSIGGIGGLFQIPQRYRFSSKSQRFGEISANLAVVLDTTKVQIFKQITTVPTAELDALGLFQIPQRYRFSSKSQPIKFDAPCHGVVLDTTKVQIFKQITTHVKQAAQKLLLFQIPQRYRFSSKSQQGIGIFP